MGSRRAWRSMRPVSFRHHQGMYVIKSSFDKVSRPRGFTLCVVTAAMLLSGCAAQIAAQKEESSTLISSGDFPAFASRMEARMGIKPATEEDEAAHVEFRPRHVLEHLEAAEAWRLAQHTKRSLAHYDAAEESLADLDQVNLAEGGARQIGAVLFNDTMLNYRPSPAESVLINYYKAIAFLGTNDKDNARVELNRADDRIRRAVETYAKEIAEAVEESEESQAKAASEERDTLSAGIIDELSPGSEWKPYKDFVVPPATYLRGLLLARTGDRSDAQQARDALVRVSGITSNSVVKQDLAELSKGRLCPKNDCLWILAEKGQGPQLAEKRLDLPLPTPSGLITLSMAIPVLESRMQGVNGLYIVKTSASEVSFSEFSSLDSVLATEYQQRLPAVVTRAVAGAIVKGVAQHELNKRAGMLAGLIGNVVAAASTAADTRSWLSTSGSFELARIAIPKDRIVIIEHQGGREVLELPAKGAVLLHIKQMTPGVKPAYVVAEL